jgi:hypothetical protein
VTPDPPEALVAQDGQQQHLHAQDPGEHDPDRGVVRLAVPAQRTHPHSDREREHEQSDELVVAEHSGSDRSNERDVRERVAAGST